MSAYSVFFSKIYDTVFFPFLHPIRKKIAQEVFALNPQNIIDMCCGTADQIKYLTNIPTANIIGIDISENMLAIANKKFSKNICIKGNAANTNFEDNQFDLAILSFILHETSKDIAENIVKEAKRVVKSKGKIILTDYVFDRKTFPFGKICVSTVEFLIGGSHFKNFKTYIKNNLLMRYTSGLEGVSEQKFIFGAVRVFTFINHKL